MQAALTFVGVLDQVQDASIKDILKMKMVWDLHTLGAASPGVPQKSIVLCR